MASYKNYLFGKITEIRSARYWNNNAGFTQEFVLDDSYTNRDGSYVEKKYIICVHNGSVQIPIPDGRTRYAVEVTFRCSERDSQNGGKFASWSVTANNFETLDAFNARQPEAQVSVSGEIPQPQAPCFAPQGGFAPTPAAPAPAPQAAPAPQTPAFNMPQGGYAPQGGYPQGGYAPQAVPQGAPQPQQAVDNLPF